jgi:competence protein ComEA
MTAAVQTLFSGLRTFMASGQYGLVCVFAFVACSVLSVLSPVHQAPLLTEPMGSPVLASSSYGLQTELLQSVHHQQAEAIPVVVSALSPEAIQVPKRKHPAKKGKKSSTHQHHKKELPKSPVNINNASEAELCKLPGVGVKMAKRIIQYRKEHGAFASIDSFIEVKGIGRKKLAKMRSYIRL